MFWLTSDEQRLIEINARIKAIEDMYSRFESIPQSRIDELIDLNTERNMLNKKIN